MIFEEGCVLGWTKAMRVCEVIYSECSQDIDSLFESSSIIHVVEVLNAREV